MGKEVSMSEVSMVCLATQDDLNMWLWELAAKGYSGVVPAVAASCPSGPD